MPNCSFDPLALRQQFPILNRNVDKYPLVYLDNAATAQKPTRVLETISKLYTHSNANIHRGVHTLSQESTALYEEARSRVAKFLNVPDPSSVIFTSGATAAINMAASTLGESYFKPGDTILVSEMEHHSNLVSWQIMAQRKELRIAKIPMLDSGELDLDALEKLLSKGARLVAITHVSNVTGIVNPIAHIADLVHQAGALLFVDGAQGVKHGALSLPDLKADFYAFSGHKIYGPTGIGVLWGHRHLMEQLPPWQGGGEMVGTVSFDGTTFAPIPFRLEAGTPPYIEAIALGEALEFYTALGPEAATRYENQLLREAYEAVAQMPDLVIYGYHPDNAAILSFNHRTIHHYDLGVLLDKMGIAVRTGTHCAEPFMQHYGITGTVRASFAFYNTRDEVQRFVAALRRALQMLS